MITPLYAGLLGLIYVYLSVTVIKGRRKNKIAIGQGGTQDMMLSIRGHGNFNEYTPLFLILLFLCEYHQVMPIFIHSAGILFITGRICHAYSLLHDEQYDADGGLMHNPKYRILGMMLTFVILIGLSVINIVQYAF